MLDFRWLKKYMPRRFFARALLILFVPILGVQIVLAAVFIQRHFEGVTRQMASGVASELTYIIATLDAADPDGFDEGRLRESSELLGIALEFEPGGQIAPGIDLGLFDLSGREMYTTLAAQLARPIAADLTVIPRSVKLDIQTDTGVLTAVVPQRRLLPSNPHLLFTWMIFTSGILVTISVVFLRNQVRPIRELAGAAEAFGKGQSIPFRPRGADEVRRAGAAFLAMRQRLERQIESRTAMLSGVSHDLRTPLTRMRLALAVSDPGPETDELLHDVAEMERMLEGFLAFARGEGGEQVILCDPVSLVRGIVQDARREGGAITLALHNETPTDTAVALRRTAVGRAVKNLVGNAMRHGETIRLTLRLTRAAAEFIVEDDGPGIPAEAREEAVKPFTRLDAARNQNAGGGVGLGLSIAADVARAHGGSLTLGESHALGGLRATLRIPR
ncbi:MAG: ATP-binding protein [Rubricella sp.]